MLIAILVQDYYILLSVQGKNNEALNFLDSIGNLTPCGHVSDMMRFCHYVSKEILKRQRYITIKRWMLVISNTLRSINVTSLL